MSKTRHSQRRRVDLASEGFGDKIMKQSYSACICKDGKWWMGVVKEVRGVMSQGRTKRELMENLQSALEEALEMNREHALS